jgi:hypothetical protein
MESTADQTTAQEKMAGMLAAAGLARRPSYRPGEVQLILGVSDRYFRYLTERYDRDPQTGTLARPDCLDSYLLRRHRRVRYDELVAFVARNNTYKRRNTVDTRQMMLFDD